MAVRCIYAVLSALEVEAGGSLVPRSPSVSITAFEVHLGCIVRP